MPGTKVDHNEMDKRSDSDPQKEGEKKTHGTEVENKTNSNINNNNNNDAIDGCRNNKNGDRKLMELEQLYRKKRESEEDDWVARMLKPYSTFLVKFPSVSVTMTLIIVALAIVLSVVKSAGGKPLPDFSDPVKGYEAKGTVISNRYNAMRNYEQAERNGKRRKRSAVIENQPYTLRQAQCYLPVPSLKNHVDELMIFYKAQDGGNLFDHMPAMCQWYIDHVRTTSQYYSYVRSDTNVHSIPNYIMYLNNITDCSAITKQHVNSFISFISKCVGYYKNGTYATCMAGATPTAAVCQTISSECRTHQLLPCQTDVPTIFNNIFHYLGHITLQDDPTHLKIGASFTILSRYSNRRSQLYKPLYESKLTDLEETKYQGIEVNGYFMWGLKFDVFKESMISQAALLAIAIFIVILLTWFFSGSLFLGLMTLGCILIAMIIAYFVYVRIFDFDFFPFLNMTVLIFIIGIGADDVFVYTGIWQEAKYIYKIRNVSDPKEHIDFMVKWTSHSLRHAVVAMFVTSLTTAAAFYANITSDVVAVKCFGLFAGTAIIVNYLLMVTFFPSAVILHDRYFSKCMHCICPCICRKYPVPIDDDESETYEHSSGLTFTQKCQSGLTHFSSILFNDFLPKIIFQFRYLFSILFLVIGIAGVVITFGDPGLNPPTTAEFQFFSKSHSLEQYDLFVKKQFAFGLGAGNYEREIFWVFGIEPTDNGYLFDPEDKGTLVYKNNFNISNEQLWLKQFCENVFTAPFTVRSRSCELILDAYKRFERPCHHSQTTCCNKTLPLPYSEFQQCIRSSIRRPIFKDGHLKAFSISIETNYKHTVQYTANSRVVNELDQWTATQISNISELNQCFWSTRLHFFDLQNSLFKGTKVSLGIAIAVAFVVILLTSVNVLLSFFSILTILFIISTTVGTLILDGWVLNILESTVLSVAAGLSADFTLHYSVAYKSSLGKNTRKERVEYAISHIGSAVFMGATTTFIAGLVMMPATVLSYMQFGTFLMVVMFFSWLYSNFFFLPVCAILGPVGYCGQLTCADEKKNERSVQLETVQENQHAEMRSEVLI